MCAAFFFAFILRPLSERACLYLGRAESLLFVRRPVAMGPVILKQGPESKRGRPVTGGPDQVKAFDAALTSAKVRQQVLYEAPHAFANPSSPKDDPVNAAAAWAKALAVLGSV